MHPDPSLCHPLVLHKSPLAVLLLILEHPLLPDPFSLQSHQQLPAPDPWFPRFRNIPLLKPASGLPLNFYPWSLPVVPLSPVLLPVWKALLLWRSGSPVQSVSEPHVQCSSEYHLFHFQCTQTERPAPDSAYAAAPSDMDYQSGQWSCRSRHGWSASAVPLTRFPAGRLLLQQSDLFQPICQQWSSDHAGSISQRWFLRPGYYSQVHYGSFSTRQSQSEDPFLVFWLQSSSGSPSLAAWPVPLRRRRLRYPEHSEPPWLLPPFSSQA